MYIYILLYFTLLYYIFLNVIYRFHYIYILYCIVLYCIVLYCIFCYFVVLYNILFYNSIYIYNLKLLDLIFYFSLWELRNRWFEIGHGWKAWNREVSVPRYDQTVLFPFPFPCLYMHRHPKYHVTWENISFGSCFFGERTRDRSQCPHA